MSIIEEFKSRIDVSNPAAVLFWDRVDDIVELLSVSNNLTTVQIAQRLNITAKTIGGILWYLENNCLGVGRFNHVHWNLYKGL